MPARTAEERIQELEFQLKELEDRVNALRKPRTDLFNIPKLEIDPSIPLAQEVSVLAETQDAKRTDLVVGFTNPRPDLIERFELWATNVTGQSKEPYLVASVKDSPAAFSIEADQDTSVSIGIRTVTKDGLSSTLGGSPTIGSSIVREPVTDITVADGSIGDAKLDRVTDPIVIDTGDIANAAIGTAQIQNAAITNALIGNLAVQNANIANSTITSAKINDLAADKITAGTLAAGVAVLGTVLAGQIQAGTMSAVNVSAGTFALTSGFEQMSIDGTDGFKQNNTSSNQVAKILGGTFTASSTAASRTVAFNNLVLNGRNTSSNEVWALRNDLTDMGESDSGYLKIGDSGGTARVRLGVDANGDGTVQLDGHLSLDEIANTPATPSSSAEARLYLKGDLLIIQFNDAGTVRYKYLDLTGTGVTWVHTTSAP